MRHRKGPTGDPRADRRSVTRMHTLGIMSKSSSLITLQLLRSRVAARADLSLYKTPLRELCRSAGG